MARIKAKPMNRLPLGHPGVGPGGMVNLKNGFRTPPAAPGTAPAPPAASHYENQPPPPPYTPTPSQQRFLYTNGTTLPHSYPSQVQIYVSRIRR